MTPIMGNQHPRVLDQHPTLERGAPTPFPPLPLREAPRTWKGNLAPEDCRRLCTQVTAWDSGQCFAMCADAAASHYRPWVRVTRLEDADWIAVDAQHSTRHYFKLAARYPGPPAPRREVCCVGSVVMMEEPQ